MRRLRQLSLRVLQWFPLVVLLAFVALALTGCPNNSGGSGGGY